MTDLTPEREQEIRRRQEWSEDYDMIGELLAALDAERARADNLEAVAKAARRFVWAWSQRDETATGEAAAELAAALSLAGMGEKP